MTMCPEFVGSKAWRMVWYQDCKVAKSGVLMSHYRLPPIPHGNKVVFDLNVVS